MEQTNAQLFHRNQTALLEAQHALLLQIAAVDEQQPEAVEHLAQAYAHITGVPDPTAGGRRVAG